MNSYDLEKTVQFKSMEFVQQIVKITTYLEESNKESKFSSPLLSSGAAICANIVEAGCRISKKDHLMKLRSAYKECRETEHWLEKIYSSKFIDKVQYLSIKKDCNDLKKILISITNCSN